MRLQFFWVPATDARSAEQDLNSFLATHRVLRIEKHFSASADGATGWAVCVEWVAGGDSDARRPNAPAERVDYKTILDPPTFKIFAALRAWRKEAALAQGVPVYSVATNEQLAQAARLRVTTRAALEQIEGFGAARIERYGEALLAYCRRELSSSASEGEP